MEIRIDKTSYPKMTQGLFLTIIVIFDIQIWKAKQFQEKPQS